MTDDALDRLGLAPDDAEVVRAAFERSLARLRSSVPPLCAAALGGRAEAAREMTTDACRRVILGTADARSERLALGAERVASFMAGDALRPGDNAPLAELLLPFWCSRRSSGT